MPPMESRQTPWFVNLQPVGRSKLMDFCVQAHRLGGSTLLSVQGRAVGTDRWLRQEAWVEGSTFALNELAP
jgi:hypothetical protein